MQSDAEVQDDLRNFRAELVQHDSPYTGLLETNLLTPIVDILLDWAVVIAAAMCMTKGPPGLWAMAIVIIGNRQRALGNIVHDAGHGNLTRHRVVNDLVAGALVAPMMFTSLRAYRETHFRHHQGLGHPATDPDFIVRSRPQTSWFVAYMSNVLNLRAWLGSLAGDLRSSAVPLRERLSIVCWWTALLGGFAAALGAEFTATFVAGWMFARATVFHAITTFREMCDHVGLRPGGIFSYTRDVTAKGPMNWLIHPRNNGYHLTHHLLPAVPYYSLPQAHRLFREMPSFKGKGTVCPRYLAKQGVVAAWSTGGNA